MHLRTFSTFLLLESYPESIFVSGGDDNLLPIHCLCESGSSIETLRFFLQKFPEQIQAANNSNGRIPLHFACLITWIGQRGAFSSPSSVDNTDNTFVRTLLELSHAELACQTTMAYFHCTLHQREGRGKIRSLSTFFSRLTLTQFVIEIRSTVLFRCTTPFWNRTPPGPCWTQSKLW